MTSLARPAAHLSDEWRTPSNLLAFFSVNGTIRRGRAAPIALERDWGDPTYCNPPYSNPLPWARKALAESAKGTRVVMLLRHDSSTEWWRLLHEAGALFCAVIGRLHFSNRGRANFPSVLVFLPLGRSHDRTRAIARGEWPKKRP